jgi:signal transduction histidine kinase
VTLSRIRLRLAGAFAVAFALSLTVVAAGALGWLWRESTARLDRRITALSGQIEGAIRREHEETPDSSFVFVLNELRHGWEWGTEGWLVLDTAGYPLVSSASPATTARVLSAWRASTVLGPPFFEANRDGDDLRATARQVRASGRVPGYLVVTFASTEGIERDTELLGWALALVAPLICVLSMVAGYLMATRALAPVHALGQAIDALGPGSLAARLPSASPPDEISELATRFNALLDRLSLAQSQNRRFVREAAHQIRTPLTLVRGEAEHALTTASGDSASLASAMGRIRSASEQMQRRVDELFLLAEAEAGVVIDCREEVDIDGLAMDVVDLFRGRAQQLDRPLAFGVMDAAVVRGNSGLLREALLELLENAGRHAAPSSGIGIAVEAGGDAVRVSVTSELGAAPRVPVADASSRLGQRIVRWIAEGHGGRFDVHHGADNRYRAVMTLPRLASAHAPLAPESSSAAH